MNKTIIRILGGVLSFGLAAWLIFNDITILRVIFLFHHNYDSPPYFYILHFAGLSLEGWQIYAMVIMVALAAALFVRLGIFAFSSKKSNT